MEHFGLPTLEIPTCRWLLHRAISKKMRVPVSIRVRLGVMRGYLSVCVYLCKYVGIPWGVYTYVYSIDSRCTRLFRVHGLGLGSMAFFLSSPEIARLRDFCGGTQWCTPRCPDANVRGAFMGTPRQGTPSQGMGLGV